MEWFQKPADTQMRATVKSEGSWWDGRTSGSVDDGKVPAEGSAGEQMTVAKLLQEYRVHLPYGVVEQVLRDYKCRDGLRFAARLYGSWTALFDLLLPGVLLLLRSFGCCSLSQGPGEARQVMMNTSGGSWVGL
jgi:hypothetical protein